MTAAVRSGGGRRRRMWVWIAGALAVVVLAGAGDHFLAKSRLEARLMRADPDAVPGDVELAQFAAELARPAWRRNCAGCHGETMQGDRSKGVPGLVDHRWIYGEGRVAEIERTILYGIRAGNA